MPIPWLINAGIKQGIKQTGLNALDSKKIKQLNQREDYAIEKYNDPVSPLYGNRKLIKEYYKSSLPIDKDVAKWTAKDVLNATNSPLYKYDQHLQNMTHDYIKSRAKRRYGGLF